MWRRRSQRRRHGGELELVSHGRRDGDGGEDERGHERLRRRKSMLSADRSTEDMERTRLITVRSEGKEMRLGGGMR
jgi:hypothetical protein